MERRCGRRGLTLTRWRQALAPGRLLRALLAWRGSIAAPLGLGWERELAVIRETRRLAPLLMSDAAALQIQICVRAVRHLGGAMAEAGVFKGASARLICEAKGDVPLHLFDVFETLQPPAGSSSADDEHELRAHFGQVHGDRREVERLLAPYFGVHLHPGLFPASATGLEDLRFSFVHLDMDLPRSTGAGLEFFHPRLLRGGILIGDDYNDAGVREVFAEHFRTSPDTLIELPWGQVMVVRQTG